jgi:hypothetical protein
LCCGGLPNLSGVEWFNAVAGAMVESGVWVS